ncbi:hypothetical protein ACP8HI_25405 [Paenibacillus sp. FA6]|uniref:hypothetical protein n=1 Tax=Paenibacillus sp. FA6 TaxID=3413029 RepID=UPI003F65F922
MEHGVAGGQIVAKVGGDRGNAGRDNGARDKERERQGRGERGGGGADEADPLPPLNTNQLVTPNKCLKYI